MHDTAVIAERGRRGAARRRVAIAAACVVVFVSSGVSAAHAQTPAAQPATSADSGPVYIPDVTSWLPQAAGKEKIGASLQILVMLTLLTVAPSILLMMTSFVRILIVLVLLRQALGTQQLPPSQVLVGLALFMTLLAMGPTINNIRDEAVMPYLNDEKGQLAAIEIAGGYLRKFMFRQIVASGNEEDVYMMYEYAAQRSVGPDEELAESDVPLTALIPAFMLSELKTAFLLGFKIYLPFLVIDMVIATVLVSMGMMMLPPVLISLPFKLLLFVLADGWRLIGGSLMAGVQ